MPTPTAEQIRQADKLQEARQSVKKNPIKKIKEVAEALSLGQYFNPFIDWLYGIALSLAILKDILDLAMIGSLPGIGSIITAMISITIGFIMFITGSSSNKRMAKSIFKRYGTILIGSLLELVFGINFLPIETCIVIIVFYLTLKERQQIAVEKQQLKESYA